MSDKIAKEQRTVDAVSSKIQRLFTNWRPIVCCARGRPIIVEWERDARHSAGLSLVRSGSSQCTLHSTCESRKVRTGAVAASAPRTRDRIRPSRRELRSTRTLRMARSDAPSSAVVMT
ncbi:hypothetical protein EVAR_84112_1 [Eumeta japonica]|uniref:Uncharacterized protein n=1 Tax=Eumeta variegata TaxID=151549 RepID=A0A4C1V082_EUMVA|nr:hypothetical protein EVAR_84112_1 [Eumeta japonica]